MKYKSFLPEAPIPSPTDLLRLLFCIKRTLVDLDACWCDSEQEAFLFSRGTQAIDALLRLLADSSVGGRLTVFVPDYFCDTALGPIRRENVRLVFYPICRNLRPDSGAVEELSRGFGSPHVFLLVHYFGFPCGVEQAHEYCRRAGAFLIEDCAHALLPTTAMGRRGDAVVYSLRKVLGVPDGALLVLRKRLLGSTHLKQHAACRSLTKWSFGKNGNSCDSRRLWLLKKAVQWGCLNLRMKWHREAPASHDSEAEEAAPGINATSPTCERLLTVYQNRLSFFCERRRTFYSILNRFVLDLAPTVRPLFRDLPAGASPYVYPLLVERDHASSLYSRLNRAGVPARSWPDLPPEVKVDPRAHAVAVALRHSIIVLPLHQSLSRKDIIYIGELLSREVMAIARRRRLGRSGDL